MVSGKVTGEVPCPACGELVEFTGGLVSGRNGGAATVFVDDDSITEHIERRHPEVTLPERRRTS